jgi:hypothetical protein
MLTLDLPDHLEQLGVKLDAAWRRQYGTRRRRRLMVAIAVLAALAGGGAAVAAGVQEHRRRGAGDPRRPHALLGEQTDLRVS